MERGEGFNVLIGKGVWILKQFYSLDMIKKQIYMGVFFIFWVVLEVVVFG